MRRKHFTIILAWVLAGWCASPILARPQGDTDNQAAQYAAEGQTALAQGRYNEAQAAFEKLAKLDPGIAEVHATLGAIYFKQREYHASIREIQTAEKLKPGLPRLDSLMGLSLAELGRYAEALPRLEKGFRDKSDPEVRRMCGLQLMRAYTNLGRDSDAVEAALALNRLYPDDPEVLYHTGRIYGNYAYIIMERLHDKAPGSIWMLQAQGEANEAQKNYDAAITAFNHVLVLDPKRPGIHYRIGRIYLDRFRGAQKAEDRDAAMREFGAELAVDPGNGNAAYELANMQIDLGNFDKARSLLEDTVKRYPDFEDALVALGRADLELHQPAEAVTALKRATQLRPDDDVAWYRLSTAQRAVGNRQGQMEALAEFRKIHQTIPVTLQRTHAGETITPQKLDSETKQ
jgi:tetratricopeptide (TPR) repeat protein